MLVKSVIDRLKTIDHELFRDKDGKAKVAGAIDMKSIETGGNFRAPAIYVIYGLSRRVGQPDFNRPRNINWQRSVVVVVRAKAPNKDSDFTHMWATDAVEAYECIIHEALSGWCPVQGKGPLIPVNTVPGRVTGDYIEIAFTFDCQTQCKVPMRHDLDLNQRIERFGLSIGNAAIQYDPCKEVDCEID